MLEFISEIIFHLRSFDVLEFISEIILHTLPCIAVQKSFHHQSYSSG